MRLIVLVSLLFAASCGNGGTKDTIFNVEGNTITRLQVDTVSLLRNPCMGWGLYDDASGEVQSAAEYWAAQDSAARRYASFFYIRWRWSDMEPKEGQYAWQCDENYKALIKGALDRGLRLAFRVYDNGQDNLRQATPDFVRLAGAKGYQVTGVGGVKLWTPYSDDKVFQEKFTKFIQAFAREYDNADFVDFIDGFNLGWWGEGHHVETLDKNGYADVFEWVTDLYTQNFKNVIPILTLEGHNYEKYQKAIFDNKGYGIRRDGLGSMWFTDREQEIVQQRFPTTLCIGESCWWQGATDDYRPWDSDTRYKFNSWTDVYKLTYEHAIRGHFNTLDLREPIETKGWTERSPELVRAFIVNGGYRFTPTVISAADRIVAGDSISIGHSWRNSATGFFPNSNSKWNYKYKPAFALLRADGSVAQIFVDEVAEPSDWIKGMDRNYLLKGRVDNLESGDYILAVAIVDRTKGSTPQIKLAIDNATPKNGWYEIKNITIIEK